MYSVSVQDGWGDEGCDILDDAMLSLLSDDWDPLCNDGNTTPVIVPDSACNTPMHASPQLVSVTAV